MFNCDYSDFLLRLRCTLPTFQIAIAFQGRLSEMIKISEVTYTQFKSICHQTSSIKTWPKNILWEFLINKIWDVDTWIHLYPWFIDPFLEFSFELLDFLRHVLIQINIDRFSLYTKWNDTFMLSNMRKRFIQQFLLHGAYQCWIPKIVIHQWIFTRPQTLSNDMFMFLVPSDPIYLFLGRNLVQDFPIGWIFRSDSWRYRPWWNHQKQIDESIFQEFE